MQRVGEGRSHIGPGQRERQLTSLPAASPVLLVGPISSRGPTLFRACGMTLAPPTLGPCEKYELIEKVRAYDPDADEAFSPRLCLLD